MTCAGLSVLACACLSALFEVHSLPLPSPDAQILLANADADATADVFVVDGLRLVAYPSAANYAARTIPLAEDTSAFDIADLDGDGRNEVIGVSRERILCYTIPAEGTAPPPRELFALHTQFADVARSPYPQVIVVKREGRPLLALPCSETVELRGTDGTLVSQHPLKEKTDIHHDVLDVLVWSFDRPDGDLSVGVSIDRYPDPRSALPDGLSTTPTEDTPKRRTYRYKGSNDRSGESYRSFTLKTDGTTSLRALYSRGSQGRPVTKIRIREAGSEEDDFMDKNIKLGPERRYPGNVILSKDRPDFNHDGYVDLVLWKAPMPGMSVDALTRAITGGAWPLDIVVHLFSPEKKRFEPVPRAQLSLTVPVLWFLQGGPIHNKVFRDFNGDERTDLACSNAKNGFAVWLFTDTGFPKSPDFQYTFPEPVSKLEFAADLDGKGRTSIGLRGEKNFYLLRAVS